MPYLIGEISDVSFSDDDRYIVVTDSDAKEVGIYDLQKKKKIAQWHSGRTQGTNRGIVDLLAWTDTKLGGPFVLVHAIRGKIDIWSPNGELIWNRENMMNQEVQEVAVHAGSRLILMAKENQFVDVYRYKVDGLDFLFRFRATDGRGFKSIAFSMDGQKIISSDGLTTREWDVKKLLERTKEGEGSEGVGP
jgi:WD40 repeat protein